MQTAGIIRAEKCPEVWRAVCHIFEVLTLAWSRLHATRNFGMRDCWLQTSMPSGDWKTRMKNRQRPFTNQVSFEPSLNKSEFLIAAGSMTADALKLRPKTGSSYQTTVPAGNRQLLKASLGQVALITWVLCSSGLHSTSTRKLLTAESRNRPSCSQTR